MVTSATSRDNRNQRQVIRKAIPLQKALVHNTAKNANTDFLDSDITPSDPPCKLRIFVCLDTAAVFQADVTYDSTEVTVEFNEGVQLDADSIYGFDLLVHSGDTVNFQADQNVTIKMLRVQEILWGS